MRVAGQYVAMHDAIVMAVNAGATRHFVGKHQVVRDILQGRIMEFMGANFNCRARDGWPWRFSGLTQLHVASPLGAIVHHGVAGKCAHHFTSQALPGGCG
jgi:hypothetical protein